MDDREHAALSGVEAVLAANRPALLRFFTSRTRDADEAQAILRDIAVRLGQAGTGPIGDPLGRIYQLGLALVIERARLRQDGSNPGAARRYASAFADAASNQRGDRIAGVLETMPAAAARAFKLRRIDGRSVSDVADRLGTTRKDVETSMTAAFRHLAKELRA